MARTERPVWKAEEIRAAVLERLTKPDAYNQAVTACRRGFTESNPAIVKEWIIQLTRCVSCFSRNTHHMIDVVLAQDLWMLADAREPLLEFLTALASSCSLYGEACMSYLIQYLYRPLPALPQANLEALEDLRKELDVKVLGALFEILSNSPGQTSNFVHVVKSHMPHQSHPAYVHDKFCHNIYDFTLAFPQLLQPMLQLMVGQLIKMDADINAVMASAPPSAKLHQQALEEAGDDADGGDRTAESAGEGGAGEGTGGADGANAQQEPGAPEREKLDTVLSYTLDFVNHKLYEEGGDPEALFDLLLTIFDEQVLMAYHTSHVQFIWFFAAHYGDGTLASRFVQACLSKLGDPAVAVIVQQAAVAYVGSFVARASYLSLNFVADVIEQCVEWAKSYIENNRTATPDVHRHTPFYALCQALFYILCFRAQDFMDAPGGHRWLRSLGLEAIVRSSLNPLKVVTTAVVDEFARIMRVYEVLLCDVQLLRNRNASVGAFSSASVVAAVENGDLCLNELETFFPFDPIHLPKSVEFVQQFYKVWSPPQSAADLAAPSLIGTRAHSPSYEDEEDGQDEEEDEEEEEEADSTGEEGDDEGPGLAGDGVDTDDGTEHGDMDSDAQQQAQQHSDEEHLVDETKDMHLHGGGSSSPKFTLGVKKKSNTESEIRAALQQTAPSLSSSSAAKARARQRAQRRSNPTSGSRSRRASRHNSPPASASGSSVKRTSRGSVSSKRSATLTGNASDSEDEDEDDFMVPEPPAQNDTELMRQRLKTLEQYSIGGHANKAPGAAPSTTSL